MPYIFMALTICNRYSSRTQTQNTRLFPKSFLTWFSCFILSLSFGPDLKAQGTAPELSILPWQLIGVDNEFITRNAKKLKPLHKELEQSLLSEAQPLDLWMEAQGKTIPLNLKHSLNPVIAGKSLQNSAGPNYIVPIICRIGDRIVVATELVSLRDNFLIASKQQFTSNAAWETEGPAPIRFGNTWAQDLNTSIRPVDDAAPAFKVDLGLLRSSHNGIEGSHECLNMLVAHELQKTMMVPTPLDLLEGYRLRQNLLPGSAPKRSTRSFLLDWGQDPTGLKITAQMIGNESVMGSRMSRLSSLNFELKPEENRILVPDNFMKALNDYRSQLLAQDKPQVAKVYRAWVYLDRGRAWGLDMNDRLYFDVGGRFVKGHVVGFYGSDLNLKSPRGFPIQEGAIVFIRKGQREVRVGDSFDFDPTAYPTPWPAVRQPSVKAN